MRLTKNEKLLNLRIMRITRTMADGAAKKMASKKFDEKIESLNEAIPFLQINGKSLPALKIDDLRNLFK